MRDCAAEAAVSTCKLERQVSGLTGGVGDCVYICVCGFLSKSHNRHHLSRSHPAFCAVLQDSQICVQCVLFVLSHRPEMRAVMIFVLLRMSESHNTSFGSHVYLHSSNSTFCNVLFHSRINHSALPFLGHRPQIDYISGVQCNDRRPS